MSKPIEALAEVASRVLQRDSKVAFPDPSAAASSEVAQLCATFHLMTESLLDSEQELNHLNQSLEQQVDQRTQELKQANLKLAALATTDPLTGLANRRLFSERLAAAFQQMKRHAQSYSVLMIDVDFFKRINDTFGHETGDKVLQNLGEMLSTSVRSTDFVARYGGEEFIILLAVTTAQEPGILVAENIRERIAATSIPNIGNITVSLGLSRASLDDVSEEDCIRRADTALYQAKEKGRNRLVVAKVSAFRTANRALHISRHLLCSLQALIVIPAVNITKQQLDGYWLVAEMATAVRL